MWNSATRLIRRFRFGEPIIVVSGLPRSGTSLMMQMLAAGGMPILTDSVRAPDASNPRGYFELEVVKTLGAGGDRSWLDQARGRAVKVVSPLLAHLPATYNYLVILMERDLAEVIASQNAMLGRAGQSVGAMSAADLTVTYHTHLRTVRALLATRRDVEAIVVDYGAVLNDPLTEATRVDCFLSAGLALDRMVAARDPHMSRSSRS